MGEQRAKRIGEDVISNETRWKAIQRRIGTKVDGWPGKGTLSSLEAAIGIEQMAPVLKDPDETNNGESPFPTPDFDSMVEYYGRPGDEGNLVRVQFPYKMRLYDRRADYTVTSHRCHKLVKDSLEAILDDLLVEFGLKGLAEHGLDVFGGIFNNRTVRGGRSKSKHAWGVAIDLNPAENQNRKRWAADKVGQSGWATMPVKAVEIFEAHGWKSGGRAWGRDAMHFQATK